MLRGLARVVPRVSTPFTIAMRGHKVSADELRVSI